MKKISTDSRISVLSVLSGILLILAFMFFFMSFAAALGFWTYRPDELPVLGPAFWMVAAVAWALSVFFGSFLTVVASRAKQVKDGILNAMTAWAGSYLLFGGIALSIADTNLRALLGSPTIGLFWQGFISDAAALGLGVVGGILGTYFERGSLNWHFHKVSRQDTSFGMPTRLENEPI